MPKIASLLGSVLLLVIAATSMQASPAPRGGVEAELRDIEQRLARVQAEVRRTQEDAGSERHHRLMAKVYDDEDDRVESKQRVAAEVPSAPALYTIPSEKDFNEWVLGSEKKVIVSFVARWSGQCRDISPQFRYLATQYPDMDFYYADIDDLSGVAASERIYYLPTFKIYKEGKAVDQFIGADTEKLDAKVKDWSLL